MEDPNWFFSTLAQSAAAIVGLIGAFLVSRIVEQANEYKEKKKELDKKISELIINEAEYEFRTLRTYYTNIIDELRGNKVRRVGGDLGLEIQIPNENSNDIIKLFNEGITLLDERRRFILFINAEPRTIFDKPDGYLNLVNDQLIKFASTHGIRVVEESKFFDRFQKILKLDKEIQFFKEDWNNFRTAFILPSYVKDGYYVLAFIAISCVFLPLILLFSIKYLIWNLVFLILFAIGLFALLRFLKRQIDEIDKIHKS